MTDKTEAPERIWVEPYWPTDNWGHCSDRKVGDDDEPFIREDVAQAMVAAALDEWVSIRDESEGVAGFHINGAMAEWAEFDLPETPADARKFVDNIQVPPHEVARIRAQYKDEFGEYPTDEHVRQEYLTQNVLLNPDRIPTPYFQPGVAGVRHILGLDE